MDSEHILSILLVVWICVNPSEGNNIGVLGTLTLEHPDETRAGSGCIPEGRNVSYLCTANDNGRGFTLWLGSAFNCPSSISSSNNQITLLHSDYSVTSGATGSCGDLSAMSVSFVDRSEYTSRLTFTATTSLNGTMVVCTISEIDQVGNDTIRVGAYPPPPQLIMAGFSSSSLIISWSPPTDQSNMEGYMIGVNGDCGDCVSMNVNGDTTSVICSGWRAAGQICSFEVRTLSQDCGLTSVPVTKNITLSVPPSPTILSVKPQYERNGRIRFIVVDFTGVEPPFIGPAIENDVTYTVVFGTDLFPGATCTRTNCSFEMNGSQLAMNKTCSVSVVASNAVGNGEPAVFPTPVATNLVSQGIARVEVDVQSSTVICSLLPSYQETINASCSMTYGPMPYCSLYTNSSSVPTGRSGDILTINLTLTGSEEFCYTVELLHGSTVLAISGTFRSECDPSTLSDGPSSQSGSGMVAVSNGMVIYSSLTPGSVAVLECDDGYSPDQSNSLNRTCGRDGHWSEGVLSCVKNPQVTGCDQSYVIAIAITVVVCLVILALVTLCVIVACCICRYRKKEKVGIIDDIDGSEKVQPETVRKVKASHDASTSTTGGTTKLKETPKPQVDMYADPNDIIPNPKLPPRNYQSGEEVKTPTAIADKGECAQYESIQEVRAVTKPQPPRGQHEVYSVVFDALPKGKSTKIGKKSTITKST